MIIDNLQIFSMNGRGLADSKKRRDVFNKIRDMNYNIYCLQDTHIEEKMERVIKAEWGKSDVVICGKSSNQRGIIILFNGNFEYKIHKVKKDPYHGNYIIVEIECFNTIFLFVVFYGPNSDNPNFYVNLGKEIRNLTMID